MTCAPHSASRCQAALLQQLMRRFSAKPQLPLSLIDKATACRGNVVGKAGEWEEREHPAGCPEGRGKVSRERKKPGICSFSPLQAARGNGEFVGRRDCSDSKVPAIESRGATNLHPAPELGAPGPA